MITPPDLPPPPSLPLESWGVTESRGRFHDEPPSRTRTPFQRDRDRIIHCAAFRRLKWKTQVFVYHEGDYFRTRLTHSLEVAQIARSVCRLLGLNQDLAEALALVHDVGHTPFGHAGEKVLKDRMAALGGFEHNVQSLRIVTKLEERYARFDGLNLTWETLEGLIKHNGPLCTPEAPEDQLPGYVATFNSRLRAQGLDLELTTWPSAEAQVAALADDIAYNNHDLDDGLRAGLFAEEEVRALPLVGDLFREVDALYPTLDRSRRIHEAVRRLFGAMVEDLTAETRRRLLALPAPATPETVRHHHQPVAAFSPALKEAEQALRKFLFRHMYRHYQVNRMTSKARRVVAQLFDLLASEPECLPDGWRERAGSADTPETRRLVADYIAGMSDRQALGEHRRLFDLQIKP